MSVRSVSFGGGVQSTALLVLAAERRIDFPLFIFANVGDDSEHPASLAYVEEHARPYAARHGIELVEVRRTWRDQRPFESLWQRSVGKGRSPIPMRGMDGRPFSRACTSDWKIEPVVKELRARGATKDNPATVALGISVDEIERARLGVDPRFPFQRRVYPLLDLGLSRRDCMEVIADAGLPVPPKSSCFFCPFHDREAWRKLKRETPDLFDRACELEASINDRRSAMGSTPVFLTRHGAPLADTIDDQLTLDGMDGCDSGWCMT